MNPTLLRGTFKPGQTLLRIGQMLWSSDGGKLAMPKLEQMAYRSIGTRLIIGDYRIALPVFGQAIDTNDRRTRFAIAFGLRGQVAEMRWNDD